MTTDMLHAVARHLLAIGVPIVAFTWAMSLAGAAIAYAGAAGGESRSLRGFLRFCFPADILRHPSCRRDVAFILSTKLVHPLAVAPLLVGNVVIAATTHAQLTAAFGARTQHQPGWWAWLAILGVLMVLQDFMNFLVHYAMHRIGALWELHKTHHSAEFLVPITGRRVHPIEILIDNLAITLPVGLFVGVTSYGFGLPLAEYGVAGIDAYFLLNALSFHHLRHSHVPLSYGRLERFLMSPVQHQLHHSCETAHWDRNFGMFLCCWDRMFGTLICTRPDDRYRLGLRHDGAEYDSVLKLYLTPLRRLAGRLPRPASTEQAAPQR